MSGKESMSEHLLKKAWEINPNAGKEELIQWLRTFAMQLVRQSPARPLRACIALATQDSRLAKQLFSAAFFSCWIAMAPTFQKDLMQTLELVLTSTNLPPEVLQPLLNLSEFMDRDEKPLPLNPHILALLAENNRAYAKALRYNEAIFKRAPLQAVEALITINEELGLPAAARGVFEVCVQNFPEMQIAESFYVKLQEWRKAVQIFAHKRETAPRHSLQYYEATTGMIRCFRELGEWDALLRLAKEIWPSASGSARATIALEGAAAVWRLGEWELMPDFIDALNRNAHFKDAALFSAILAIHTEEYDRAQDFVDRAREHMDVEMNSLLGESYSRAYNLMTVAQQLAELEEVIVYKTTPRARAHIREIWDARLEGTDRSVSTWHQILSLRALALEPTDDKANWIKFAALCRKNARHDLSYKIFTQVLALDPAASLRTAQHDPLVVFAYLTHLWAEPATKSVAFAQLKLLAPAIHNNPALSSKIYRKLGDWEQEINGVTDYTLPSIIYSYQCALKFDQHSYKPWHAWGLAHYEAISYYEQNDMRKKIFPHLVPAIKALFRSIEIGKSRASLQDSLRLLTLLFKNGNEPEIETTFMEGANSISITYWLQVVPQLIARIHSTVPSVRKPVHEILVRLARAHPQTLVFSLFVAQRSNYQPRMEAAKSILEKMRKQFPEIVEQAEVVSSELIRCSVIWHEMWHNALEEASRAYFHERNTEGMFDVLRPLHEMIERGPTTLQERAFVQTYARELQEAWQWCKKFMRTQKPHDLNQAWDIYYRIFRRLTKQLPTLMSLELVQLSPILTELRDLKLAVPGTYYPNRPEVFISTFDRTLTVISSKQRPRKLIINGSQGDDFMFLLKGNEDLRQDERVMQLFGLVNGLLASNYETAKDQLSIARFSVIPLSPNSGLIGWVPHYDTMHQLIREFRENREILINVEHKMMLRLAPDYDTIPVINKVEAFEQTLNSTQGDDLERILWLKSGNSEEWLDRRTNYTRSLAVMSMVGYLLGLGDRHPSNLMIDRHTGRVLHIDFGDCFEVAMFREKYPETIPFRLTRMLINAMEVSGLNGTFRSTCQVTMNLLRRNKESVMAVLEAFIYDPLINLHLLAPESPAPPPTLQPQPYSSQYGGQQSQHNQQGGQQSQHNQQSPVSSKSNKPRPEVSELSSSLYKRLIAPESEPEIPDLLNKRALKVINRVNSKLTGRDFGAKQVVDVPKQIDLLIRQATSHENLCQCYIGWCKKKFFLKKRTAFILIKKNKRKEKKKILTNNDEEKFLEVLFL